MSKVKSLLKSLKSLDKKREGLRNKVVAENLKVLEKSNAHEKTASVIEEYSDRMTRAKIAEYHKKEEELRIKRDTALDSIDKARDRKVSKELTLAQNLRHEYLENETLINNL